MPLALTLSRSLSRRQIASLASACRTDADDSLKSRLLDLISNPDNRVAYNALWVLTALPAADNGWLRPQRDAFIDMLLKATHSGIQRLLFTLLDRMPVEIDSLRPDYLDFCLSHINSTAPTAIRAFALKQAAAQCRFYPDLASELRLQIDIMHSGPHSPGLLSALRIALRRLSIPQS